MSTTQETGREGTPRAKRKIGEMLLAEGVLGEEQLDKALQAQLVYGGRLGTNLLELGFISEEALTSALGQQLGIRSVRSELFSRIPLSVVNRITPALADKFRVVPFNYEKEARRLDVALVDPTDLSVVDSIAFHTGLGVRPHVAPEAAVVSALERYYGIKPDRRYIRLIDFDRDGVDVAVDEDLVEPAAQPPVSASSASVAAVPPVTTSSYLDLAECVRRIDYAVSDAEIFDLVISCGKRYFTRQYILAERARQYEVVVADGMTDADAIQGKTMVPIAEGNILHAARETLGFSVGPVPPTAENHAFMATLNEDPYQSIAVFPLVSQGRADHVWLAAGFKLSLGGADHRFLQILMDKASLGRDILVLRRRLALLPDDSFGEFEQGSC